MSFRSRKPHLPLWFAIPTSVLMVYLSTGSVEETAARILNVTFFNILPIAVTAFIAVQILMALTKKRDRKLEQAFEVLQTSKQWKNENLVAAAHEIFRGVIAFKNKNDIEGLRYYMHPEFLNDYKNEFSLSMYKYKIAHIEFRDSSVVGLKNLAGKENDTFTIRFQGTWQKLKLKDGAPVELIKESFLEYWKFEWEQGRWMLRSTSESAGAEYLEVANEEAS